jgi:outer membrane protein OmpA-like peptidoglycan-associated protein
MKTNFSCKRGAIAGAVALTLGWSALAQAQTLAVPNAALNRYEPAERGSEWFANDSLDFRGTFRPAFGITGDYAHAPYTQLNPDGSKNTAVIENTMYLHVGAAFVLFERLRIGLSLPIAVAQSGHDKLVDNRSFIGPTQGGLGDLRVAADVRVVGEYGDAFTLAIGGRMWLPTGNTKEYIGDGKVRVGPHVSFAGDIGAFVYSGGIGFVYRANDALLNGHPSGSEANFNAGFGLRLADKKLVIGPEVFGSTVVTEKSAVFGNHTTPLALVVGGHYTAGSFRVGLGAGPGLSNAAGTPEFRGLLSLDYIPEIEKEEIVQVAHDRDRDGVVDLEDACPDVAGVRTDDPKTSGCPADRDADGIFDSEDACPTVPGVRTTDPKTNGCPGDRDADGVVDTEDACPDIAGMKNADPKVNGCPPDGDKDGIFDRDDACPTVPGVKTNNPKTNGCPSDRDGDGIIDTEDACPDVVGQRSDDPKKNGCPLVCIVGGEVKIGEQIMFRTGSDEILGVSTNIIVEVSKVLIAHPEIKRIRIEGHTDNQGPAGYNKELSRRRAASVAGALVKTGLSKDLFVSEGYGFERPIGDNGTVDGRTANRRVEFHIEEQTAKK